METVFIKKGEYGEKIVKFENPFHRKILYELCVQKQNSSLLSTKIDTSEIDTRRYLEFLEKTKLVKCINGKWSLDFIALNEENTQLLTEIIQTYSNFIIPKIIDELHKLDKNIEFKENNSFTLVCLICIDILMNEVCEKIKEVYQNKKQYSKKWSMTAYTQENSDYIFRNDTRSFSLNPQGKEAALFTYGGGKPERFDKEVYGDFNILKFTAEQYASFVYLLTPMIERLSDESIKNSLKALEKEIEYYYKNQLPYVVENQIPFVRYNMIEYLRKNGIASSTSKYQFIITF